MGYFEGLVSVAGTFKQQFTQKFNFGHYLLTSMSNETFLRPQPHFSLLHLLSEPIDASCLEELRRFLL